MNLGFSLRLICLTLIMLIGRQAWSYVDLSLFYGSQGLTRDTSVTGTETFIEASLGFRIDKKGRFLAGWGYSQFTTAEAGTSERTYASTQMGPRFIIFIDREQSWPLGFGYNLVTTATFKEDSGSEEKWKGTGLKFDFGYNFKLDENFAIGVRYNYSSTSYTEKFVGETDYSTISYTRTHIYPSLSAFYSF